MIKPFLGHGRESEFVIGALQIIRLHAKRENHILCWIWIIFETLSDTHS